VSKKKLDPESAHAGFGWQDDAGCIGRFYYWYSPSESESFVLDRDLRTKYPEVSDAEWERLFRAACDRDEARIFE